MVQSEIVYYVIEAIDALSKANLREPSNNGATNKITLIGHSLGAGVASLTSAAFPELVDKLVLLDAASFLARKADDTAFHVRNHVVRRQKHDPSKESRIYPNLELAIQVRRQSASRMPGKQTLSCAAAKELVERTQSLTSQSFTSVDLFFQTQLD